MPNLNQRAAAVRATQIRFANRPFKWGAVDCIKVAAFHVRQVGHKPASLAKAGKYRSALSARRALQNAGYDSLTAAIEGAGLVEIAPASALMGDLIVLPGNEGWESVLILIGPNTAFGFHEEALTLVPIRFDPSFARAWSL